MNPLCRLALVPAFFWLPVGCYSTSRYIREGQPLSPVLQRPAKVDVEASELQIDDDVYPTDTAARARLGREIREDIANGLDDLLGAPTGNPIPVRYRIHVTRVETDAWYSAACLGVLIYVGCPILRERADVKVELESLTRHWSATGHASAWVGLYYNLRRYPGGAAIGKAIADALGQIRLHAMSFTEAP